MKPICTTQLKHHVNSDGRITDRSESIAFEAGTFVEVFEVRRYRCECYLPNRHEMLTVDREAIDFESQINDQDNDNNEDLRIVVECAGGCVEGIYLTNDTMNYVVIDRDKQRIGADYLLFDHTVRTPPEIVKEIQDKDYELECENL